MCDNKKSTVATDKAIINSQHLENIVKAKGVETAPVKDFDGVCALIKSLNTIMQAHYPKLPYTIAVSVSGHVTCIYLKVCGDAVSTIQELDASYGSFKNNCLGYFD